MNSSPFRCAVLPMLLASSAGFMALTWPMVFACAVQVSARLPQPLSYGGAPALVAEQHHDFSMRYMGAAVLSSVAIAIGTTKTLRLRQGQRQRRVCNPVPLAGDQREDRWGDRLPPAEPIDRHSPGLAATAAAATPTLARVRWRQTAELRSSPIEDHALYHIQCADQGCSLALAIEGEYYRYYRNRPDLDKAQTLVKLLHLQGKRALATWDDSGYVVWVHQPERPQQAVPWLGRLATG